MPILSRLSTRTKVLLGLFAALSLVAFYQLAKAWWLHGYSQGTRSGVIRRISYKGSPLCKYWLGEMVVTATAFNGVQTSTATAPEIWEFSVQAPSEKDPLILQLQDAEKSGQRATVSYRQDKGRWWDCTPTEFFVTGIAK